MLLINYNSSNLIGRKFSDSKVDIFNINDNQLLSILFKKKRFFLILKLTFIIKHNNLVYNKPILWDDIL